MSTLLKVFFALGGIGILFGLISKGVPALIAWAMPLIVAGVHRLMAWLLGKPAIRASAVKYRPQLEDLLNKLEAGLKQIFDAALAAAEEDLDKADVPAGDKPA